MQSYKFKALGIVSAKKPFNTHLWVETSAGILWLVDSGDQTKLYKSTDKGANWSLIDTTDNEIRALWLDDGNDKLYYCDCNNANDNNDIDVNYIDLTDDSVNSLGTLNEGAGEKLFALDIFLISGSPFLFVIVDGVVGQARVYSIDDPGFTEIDAVASDPPLGISHAAIISGIAYFVYDFVGNTINILKFDNPFLSNLESQVNFQGGTVDNLRGLASDNSDVLYMVLEDTDDNKNYLCTYAITADIFTQLAEYNIALMLDRNNVGTVPNEFEKGFSIDSTETVFEITPKRSGIRILQDISNITDAIIIAITDNFLMNDDGDMFEFTDVTNEISTILYNDGIVGIPKRGNFTVHPDFHINWNKGDSIKIYDQYDQLEFHGLITDKNRNSRGIYVYKIDSFTNEIFRKTYSTTYSGDDLDTKQKDIIDNACDFCYRSSSIVGTTTTFNYVYNRALIYLFWLGRRLERQVPYIEPDGKIWTKAHDGLSKNAMIYPGTHNFKDLPDGTSGTDIPFITGGGDADHFVILSTIGEHRKVMSYFDDDGSSLGIHDFDAAHDSGTIELYWSSNDVANMNFRLHFRDVGDDCYFFRFVASQIQDSGGGMLVATVNDTRYHLKIQWYADNTIDLWVNEVLELDGDAFDINMTTGLTRVLLRCFSNDNTKFTYIDAWGESWDPAYTVGDNEVAWDINNNWQDVQFIDIPGIEEMIQGFFDGNTGITRNTIRYRDNAQIIRPVAATRDPIEQLQGILPLNEFRDPKIEESTEADQLGDNRYAIWSADTLFLGLRVLGQGYLQPGKTIHVENTGQISVAESNLLLLSFVRDPKNDVYSQMILSDNIIFPSEFTNLDNTSPQQTHTSIVQSFENQADIIAHLTPEGGLALRLTNKTGVNSVKGTIVEAHAATDNAFRVCDANSVESFGVVYEDGIADGSECLVVIGGRVQVLLKDATLSTRGNWVEVSDVAGRADATGASPAASPQHFQEIGHAIESKGADTDVLAYIIIHFL